MNNQKWLLASRKYQARLLQPQNKPVLQKLCQACPDYFEMTSNSPAAADEARNIFSELPKNKLHENKLVVGIFDKSSDTLIGVLDLIKHYPIEGVIMLGLLLLHPEHRKGGLGRQIFAHLANWWQSQNGHTAYRGAGTKSISTHVLAKTWL